MANTKKYLDEQGLRTLWTLIKAKIANLADNKSTIYLDENEHLSIKGYNEATQGQMLVKDMVDGLTWVKPLDSSQLDQAVAAATAQATQAGVYATQAGNSATAADTSAQTAERINEQTMAWVNNKFWWGDLDEYNALESLTEGTFYFVQLP